MIIDIIVGTHGKFCLELLKSSEMTFTKQENIECVTFETEESADDLVKKYNMVINRLDVKD